MSRVVAVSNRVSIPRRGAAPGGLAVGVLAAMQARGGLWFGWSGQVGARDDDVPEIVTRNGISFATIDLEQQEFTRFLNGFSNGALWPTFHYFLETVNFSDEDYAGYLAVNRRFAATLKPLLRDDDLLWVHDFHLIPLVRALREQGAQQPAAFFLHFDPAFHRGQPAVDKHLEYFRQTDMDFVKIQFELPFPVRAEIVRPADWRKMPLYREDFYAPQLDVVKGLVKAAKKDASRLKDVGVTPQEIVGAGKLLAAVTAERKRYATQNSAYLDRALEHRAARDEAKRLISKVKRRVSLALSRDLDESSEVKERAGIGHPTYAPALKKRGVAAADLKRLEELAEVLANSAERASATERSNVTELFSLVAYLRDAAGACSATTVFAFFGTGSRSTRRRSRHRPPEPAATKVARAASLERENAHFSCVYALARRLAVLSANTKRSISASISDWLGIVPPISRPTAASSSREGKGRLRRSVAFT